MSIILYEIYLNFFTGQLLFSLQKNRPHKTDITNKIDCIIIRHPVINAPPVTICMDKRFRLISPFQELTLWMIVRYNNLGRNPYSNIFNNAFLILWCVSTYFDLWVSNRILGEKFLFSSRGIIPSKTSTSYHSMSIRIKSMGFLSAIKSFYETKV